MWSDLIDCDELLDSRLHRVLISRIMEMEQMMERLLAKIDARMDSNTKTMQEKNGRHPRKDGESDKFSSLQNGG
jgi:hypothetical protein